MRDVFLEEAHESIPGSEYDYDWTMGPWDRARELRRRQLRNMMIHEKLLEGATVVYRQSGWSLYPIVSSNDRCTFKPVRHPDQVQEQDVVFCLVQPNDRHYAHWVKKKYWAYGDWCFTISNLAGRENGWCQMKHIFGKLISAEP